MAARERKHRPSALAGSQGALRNDLLTERERLIPQEFEPDDEHLRALADSQDAAVDSARLPGTPDFIDEAVAQRVPRKGVDDDFKRHLAAKAEPTDDEVKAYMKEKMAADADLADAKEHHRKNRLVGMMGRALDRFTGAATGQRPDFSSDDLIIADAENDFRRAGQERDRRNAAARQDRLEAEARDAAARKADWDRERWAIERDDTNRRHAETLDSQERRAQEAARATTAERALRREEMRAALGLKTNERHDERTERAAEEVTKRLDGLPEMKNNLETLLRFAGQDDIPGVGTVAGRMPNLLTSDEGVQVRQAAKGVIAALIKARSGASASDREVERLMDELGMGSGASDREFRMGLDQLLSNVRDTYRTKEAGVPREALERARSRGAVTTDDLPAVKPSVPPPSGAADLVPMIAPDGSKRMVPRSKVNAALAKGGRLAR